MANVKSKQIKNQETQGTTKKVSKKPQDVVIVKTVKEVPTKVKKVVKPLDELTKTIEKEFVSPNDYPLRDKEVATINDLVYNYGGVEYEDKEFIGNGYFAIRKGTAVAKEFRPDSETTEMNLTERVLKKYAKHYGEAIKGVDDIPTVARLIKGVCYKCPCLMTMRVKGNPTRMKVNSVLKLSKWVALDSTVRKVFKNHSFIYLNDEKTPVLIINNETNKVEGYIMPNSIFWKRNGGDRRPSKEQVVQA